MAKRNQKKRQWLSWKSTMLYTIFNVYNRENRILVNSGMAQHKSDLKYDEQKTVSNHCKSHKDCKPLSDPTRTLWRQLYGTGKEILKAYMYVYSSREAKQALSRPSSTTLNGRRAWAAKSEARQLHRHTLSTTKHVAGSKKRSKGQKVRRTRSRTLLGLDSNLL